MFDEIDEALEAEEMLPRLDESSDDEGPMPPPDSEGGDDTDSDTSGFLYEYRGPRDKDPKVILANTPPKDAFKDKPKFVPAMICRNTSLGQARAV